MSRVRPFQPTGAALAAAALLAWTSSPAFATDAATGGAGSAPAAAAPSVEAAPAPASKTADKPAITELRCENLAMQVAWKGGDLLVPLAPLAPLIVDYYSAGEPYLQARKDPAPGESSLKIALGKEWEGRKIDVRLFTVDGVTLFDTKTVECKAKTAPAR